MLGDLDLHQRVGRVGRGAAAGRQLELGHQLLLAHAEALRDVGHRRLAHLGQPAHHGEQAAEATARLRARVPSGPGRLRARGADGDWRSSVAAGAIRLAGGGAGADRSAVWPGRWSAEAAVDEATRASSQATISSRTGRRFHHDGVIEQAQQPGTDGREGRHAEQHVDGAVVVAGHHLVLPHLVGHPAGHHGVDPDAQVDPVVTLGLPGLLGHGGLHVDLDVVGQRGGRVVSLRVTSPSMRSTRNVRWSSRSRS